MAGTEHRFSVSPGGSEPARPADGPVTRTTRRILIGVAVAAVAAVGLSLLWFGAQLLLLGFGGILAMIFLYGLGDWLSRHTGLGYGWSLAGVVVAIVGAFALTIWLLAPHVIAQVNLLSEELPRATANLEHELSQFTLGQEVVRYVRGLAGNFFGNPAAAAHGSTMAARSATILKVVFEGFVQLVLVLFLGLYGAATPDVYVSGLVRLVPVAHRPRAREVLHEIGETLWYWLVCRMVSMAWVAAATMVGLWLLGVPLALTLGLFAGLVKFVPYIGPIIAVIPAALLALMPPGGLMMVLFVLALYLGINMIDDHVVLPLLQWHTMWLPPALAIAGQILLGGLWGALGVLFAMPLAAVLLVLVKMLYVEDVLGDAMPSLAQGAAPANGAGRVGVLLAAHRRRRLGRGPCDLAAPEGGDGPRAVVLAGAGKPQGATARRGRRGLSRGRGPRQRSGTLFAVAENMASR